MRRQFVGRAAILFTLMRSPINNRFEMVLFLAHQCIPKLSASERGVYAASLSPLSQLSLALNLVGSLTLKRPDARAPTNRPLWDAPLAHKRGGCWLLTR